MNNASSSADSTRECQTVIFSKDRPAQLELLLRSLTIYRKDEIRETWVIYKCSDIWAADYAGLAAIYSFVHFIDESGFSNFKSALLSTDGTASEFILFLVDDQVFLRAFDLRAMIDEFLSLGTRCTSLSLRMHPGVIYSYCSRTICPSRTLNAEDLSWRWSEEPLNSEWSVIASLDGNIYRKNDIVHVLRNAEYANPCFLEQHFVNEHGFGAESFARCFAAPVVVTLPLNQTQSTHSHRHGGLVDLDELNGRFRRGNRIALMPLALVEGATVHREQRLVFFPDHPADADGPFIHIDGDQPLQSLFVTIESLALLPERRDVVVHARSRSLPAPLAAVLSTYGQLLRFEISCDAGGESLVPEGFFFPSLPSSCGPEETAALSALAFSARKLQWQVEVIALERNMLADPANKPLAETNWREEFRRRSRPQRRGLARRIISRLKRIVMAMESALEYSR